MGNIPGNHTKEECFEECQKKRKKLLTNITGCEHKNGIECHYHTIPIGKGNGREGATCCAYGHIDIVKVSYLFVTRNAVFREI